MKIKQSVLLLTVYFVFFSMTVSAKFLPVFLGGLMCLTDMVLKFTHLMIIKTIGMAPIMANHFQMELIIIS